MSDDPLALSDPNDLRNIVLQLQREVEALRQSVVSAQSASEVFQDLGDLDVRAVDTDGRVRGIMSPVSLEEEFGIKAHFAGFDTSGRPQFWLSSDNGFAAFAAGSGRIDDEGVTIDGYNSSYDLTGEIDNTYEYLGRMTGKQTSLDLLSAIKKISQSITNGDFETGDTTGWTVTDSGSNINITTDARGNYGLEISAVGSSVANNISQSLASGMYLVEFWAKTDVSTSLAIDGGASTKSLYITASDRYKKYSVTFPVPITQVKFYISTIPATLCIDDVTAYEIYTETALQLVTQSGSAGRPTLYKAVRGSLVSHSIHNLLTCSVYAPLDTPIAGFGGGLRVQLQDNDAMEISTDFVNADLQNVLVRLKQRAGGIMTRESILPAAGWLPFAFPKNFDANGTIVATAMTANGSTRAAFFELSAPMMLRSASFWNTDISGARKWNWHLFVQDTQSESASENTLRRIAYGAAAEAFTATAASLHTIAASNAPVYLPPGAYVGLIQNEHATQTLGIGVMSGNAFLTAVNVGMSRTVTNPIAGDLDFTLFAKNSQMYCMRLNGEVFGQNAAF